MLADAARYVDFLEYGDNSGLTPSELAGIQKLDDGLVLGRVDYDEVLTLRRQHNADFGYVTESDKYFILSYEDAEDIAFNAIHGPDKADAVVLGKYRDGGPTAYTSVAKDMDAQYFQLDN